MTDTSPSSVIPAGRAPRVTENDSYIASCVREILCRAFAPDEYDRAMDTWLDWYPANRAGWFHWSRAFGAFLHLWRTNPGALRSGGTVERPQ